MTTLIILIIIGAVLYFVLRGKQDRPEQLGAARRGLPTGPLEPHTFPCPYPKCPTCGATGDKMKQEWDGMRSVKWSCGYCSAVAGLQSLKDEELPPSARRQLGLDAPAQGSMPMQPGGPGGGMGGLLTGMMLGSMMGGGDRHHHDGSNDGDGWGGGSAGGSGGSSSDWGESSSGSSDWGDSGGGDSGGGDSGGDW